MKANWSVELSPYADGIWIAAHHGPLSRVIAPPGVLLGEWEKNSWADGFPAGWRVGVWRAATEATVPLVDVERPDTVHSVSTRFVVDTVSPELHHVIWGVLLTQLENARAFGLPANGVPDDELALAGALAADWVEREMLDAFPSLLPQSERCLGDYSQLDLPVVPDTSAELLALLGVSPSEPGGARRARGSILVAMTAPLRPLVRRHRLTYRLALLVVTPWRLRLRRREDRKEFKREAAERAKLAALL